MASEVWSCLLADVKDPPSCRQHSLRGESSHARCVEQLCATRGFLTEKRERLVTKEAARNATPSHGPVGHNATRSCFLLLPELQGTRHWAATKHTWCQLRPREAWYWKYRQSHPCVSASGRLRKMEKVCPTMNWASQQSSRSKLHARSCLHHLCDHRSYTQHLLRAHCVVAKPPHCSPVDLPSPAVGSQS